MKEHRIELRILIKYSSDAVFNVVVSLQVECEKGPNSDKQGFANLVKELRSAFSSRGLLLSAAVSGSKRVIDYGKFKLLFYSNASRQLQKFPPHSFSCFGNTLQHTLHTYITSCLKPLPTILS